MSSEEAGASEVGAAAAFGFGAPAVCFLAGEGFAACAFAAAGGFGAAGAADCDDGSAAMMFTGGIDAAFGKSNGLPLELKTGATVEPTGDCASPATADTAVGPPAAQARAYRPIVAS